MVNGLIGKKVGMIRFFIENGEAVPVTVIEAGPCTVIQKKTENTDGYEAIQLGFESRKKVNQPQAGHFRAAGAGNFAVMKEFKTDQIDELEVGQEITLDIFEIGEKVSVTGTTKGRGFAGVIKRHGFAGGSATHGDTAPRAPGSIGAAAYPARVFPGKRMAGHYGNVRQTTRHLEVIDVRPEYGVILVKGAVPGPRNGIVLIKKHQSS
ncbi:MAG: 50S ribosomal protein L3 [Deltaproteobacteria bacterium]|nr:50S ribosomal protein L3 [Deltaproteobacteria bacterium]MBW2051722.1 50S ribosomal protein L3 [Deltaproteobacteria bacterium]MBW2140261.1 50S ribosomal protein L3 [Deltaproteobacteria bacterium]MBW2322104.1 50S ribosomal protein L3 [Deltaproteobacteria bacterium]